MPPAPPPPAGLLAPSIAPDHVHVLPLAREAKGHDVRVRARTGAEPSARTWGKVDRLAYSDERNVVRTRPYQPLSATCLLQESAADLKPSSAARSPVARRAPHPQLALAHSSSRLTLVALPSPDAPRLTAPAPAVEGEDAPVEPERPELEIVQEWATSSTVKAANRTIALDFLPSFVCPCCSPGQP
jgi:hypothetical protein